MKNLLLVLLIASPFLALGSIAVADDSRGLDGLVQLLGSVDDEAFQLDLLNGMTQALKGRTNVAQPSGWSKLAAKLSKSSNEEVRQKVAELSLQFGDAAAMKNLVAQAVNRKLKPAARIRAIELLTQKRAKELAPNLGELLVQGDVRGAAIGAVAVFELPEQAATLVRQYQSWPNEHQQAAIATLCSRISYARLLLTAIEESQIPARDVSAFHARQLQSYGDEEINRRLKTAWGELRTSSQQNRQQIERLLKVMSEDFVAKADIAHGKALFKKTCASCHKLYSEGGDIGPNLTGSNRTNLLYVVENVIDPSAAVAKDYTVTSILTNDGRKLSGIIGRQTARTIEVQTLKEKIVLDRADIDMMKRSTQSMMPEGLIEKLSDADFRDLIGYLRVTKPLPLIP